jgi:hypothetical protein
MSVAKQPGWPRFETVTFPEPTCVPYGWDAPLVTSGVPRSLIGQSYLVADDLAVLGEPENGPLIRFGLSGLSHNICLNPRTVRSQ